MNLFMVTKTTKNKNKNKTKTKTQNKTKQNKKKSNKTNKFTLKKWIEEVLGYRFAHNKLANFSNCMYNFLSVISGHQSLKVIKEIYWVTNLSLAPICQVMKKIKKIKVNDVRGSSLRPGDRNLLSYHKWLTVFCLGYEIYHKGDSRVFENIPNFVIFFKHCWPNFDLMFCFNFAAKRLEINTDVQYSKIWFLNTFYICLNTPVWYGGPYLYIAGVDFQKVDHTYPRSLWSCCWLR